MGTPLVSVLVPVYNVEPYIERCARSLFEQTYDNLEFIFCDDCSTDRSVYVLEQVIRDYPNCERRIRIVHHDHNRGLAAARNTLVEFSKGVFVFWVDSDDWVETNAVELLVAKQQETDADFVTGRALAHDVDKVSAYFDGGWDLNRKSLLDNILRGKRGASVWRRLIRRRLYTDYVIRGLEGVDGREDFQVTIPLIFYSSKVAGIDAFIYHYNRENLHSITYDYMNNLIYQIQSMRSRLFIRDFFVGKDDYYLRIISEGTVSVAHKYMMHHYQQRNRKGYQIMVDYIEKIDRKYWKRIRWDNWMIRFMESNYYMMCFTCPLRQLRHKLSQ